VSETVAQHGVRWRFNGFPIFDDDGCVVGTVQIPAWKEADLTEAQRQEVDEMVAKAVRERPNDPWTRDRFRWAIMESEGIEHTHRVGKPIVPRRPTMGYECPMCLGYIVNENPGDYLFVGGPADGRWIVTGGRSTFLVPIPAPILAADLLQEPLNIAGPRMSVAQYQRVGDRYYVHGAEEADRVAADALGVAIGGGK
jgi:hypothetical protein